MSRKEQPCAERIAAEFESRERHIRIMLDWPGTPDDWSLGDDGTLDTVAVGPDGEEYRFSAECAASYRDEETGAFGWIEFVQKEIIGVDMEPYDGGIHDFGLSFDWVNPTDRDPACDAPGYWCYLMSTGGPHDEFRFYAGPDGRLIRAEYVFQDWFDGATLDVTDNGTVRDLWDWLSKCLPDRGVR